MFYRNRMKQYYIVVVHNGFTYCNNVCNSFFIYLINTKNIYVVYTRKSHRNTIRQSYTSVTVSSLYLRFRVCLFIACTSPFPLINNFLNELLLCKNYMKKLNWLFARSYSPSTLSTQLFPFLFPFSSWMMHFVLDMYFNS